MKRYCSICLGLCAFAIVPGQAAAQGGSGLYEQFPEPASKERSSEFVTSLLQAQARRDGAKGAQSVSEKQLEEGLVIAGGAAPATGGPSARAAGGRGFEPSFGWPAGLLLGLAALVIPPLALRRR